MKLGSIIDKFTDKAVDAVTHRKAAYDDLNTILAGKGSLTYTPSDCQAGDIFFHFVEGYGVTHVNMVSTDITQKVDSVVGDGVRIVHLTSDRKVWLGFRYNDSQVAYAAAALATGWAGTVGYSDVESDSYTSRQVHLAFGSSHFGKGAAGRIHKYTSRGKTPKNVTCPEMCLLAYQLSMVNPDKDLPGAKGLARIPGFPQLDAKHTSAETLSRWLLKAPGWSYEGVRIPA